MKKQKPTTDGFMKNGSEISGSEWIRHAINQRTKDSLVWNTQQENIIQLNQISRNIDGNNERGRDPLKIEEN